MRQEVLLFIILAVLAYQDCKKRTVNLYLILMTGAVGIFIQAVYRPYALYEILAGMGVGAFICLISVLTKGKIGLGDGAVLILSGLFLGFGRNMELCVTALYLSGIAALLLLIVNRKRRNYSIPFVPFLFIAYVWRILV